MTRMVNDINQTCSHLQSNKHTLHIIAGTPPDKYVPGMDKDREIYRSGLPSFSHPKSSMESLFYILFPPFYSFLPVSGDQNFQAKNQGFSDLGQSAHQSL
jgi:hypothetical protein